MLILSKIRGHLILVYLFKIGHIKWIENNHSNNVNSNFLPLLLL